MFLTLFPISGAGYIPAAFAETLSREYSNISVAERGLVLSAGLFEELTVEDYEQLNRVNYLGVIYTVKAGYASIQRG